MKLYIQVGMGFSTTDERKAETWKSKGLDVVVIDAEAYQTTPKPERWVVADESGHIFPPMHCAICVHCRGWYERCAHPMKGCLTPPSGGQWCEKFTGKGGADADPF